MEKELKKNLDLKYLKVWPNLNNTNSKQKPIILLIHGFATDHRCFRYLENEISKISLNYYSFDLPGSFVGIKYPIRTLRVSNIANLISSFILENKLDNIILIGHSMGGAIAAMVAAKLPKNIRSLILLSPLNRTSLPKLINKFDKFQVKDYKSFMKLQKEIFVNPEKTLEEIDKKEYIEQSLLLFKNNFKYLLVTMFSIVDILEIIKLDTEYKKIKSPTLVILGKNDHFILVNSCEKYFKNIISNVDIQIIDSAGHGFFIEKKDEFMKLILDFIQK